MASAPGGGGRALGGGRGAPVDDIELAPRLPATPAGAFGALDEEDELELIQRRAATHWSYFETSRCGSRQWAGALFGLGAVLFILVLTMIFSPKVNLRPLPKDPALPGAAPGAAGPAAPYRDQSSFHAEFVSMPDPRRCEEHLKYYTGVPHIAGSKEDYDTAVYTRDKLRAYLSPHPGATVDIVEYQVMLCYPDKRSVELLAPTYASLKLEEPALPFDKTSGQEALRKAGSPYATFNAYSGSGDVTADLVYANHGLPEDFDALAAAGVSVEGRLVLVRYGRNFRGLKVMLAEERGAAGVLIYSDPADDGYGRGPVFPEGPWRSNSSVQRGSVQYISVYPGDPLTPGYASTANAPRLARSEAKNLPKIPVQPLSADDARPLLAALGGAPAASLGARWQGGLPLEYRLGPGPARVRMQVFPRCEERQPIWNVIAKLPGKEEPDRAVILGNHRDAWVFGAADPNSGTASMLELARGFGVLLSAGWRPRRTVVLASWDAEEYALVGSTEWVEDNRAWLEESAVAYLNVDTSTTGPHFFADTTPPLFGVVREAAMTVPDPRLVAECRGDRPAGRGPAPAACALGTSLHAAWLARSRERNETGPNRDTPGYNFLGSGSDFTPFYQHVGVPSFEIGFSGDYGVYHSIYDSFAWMANYGDPGFLYHAACAAVWGSVALRLADAAVLPLDYAEYGRALREQVVERARKAEEAAGRGGGRALDLTPLRSAVDAFAAAGMAAEGERRRLAGAARAEGGAPAAALRSLNDRLVRAERALLDPAGLERHGVAWYRHLVFAPGLYAGYSSAVFPALAEAMDAGDGPRAAAEQLRLAAAIRRAAGVLLGA